MKDSVLKEFWKGWVCHTKNFFSCQDLAPNLNVSLKASGKSRADLWALATISAVEFTSETNNMLCDGTYNNNPEKQCNQEVGTNQCMSNLKSGLKFYTGRKDCTGKYFKPMKSKIDQGAIHILRNVIGVGGWLAKALL